MIRCNTPLVQVDKAVVLDRLESLPRRYFDEFCLCSNCNQIYRKGLHYERMAGLITGLRSAR